MNRAEPAITQIRPAGQQPLLDVQELWRERALLGFFLWRSLAARYRETTLGAAWAVIPPLVTMAAFSLLFGRVVRVHSLGLPYPVFYLAALVPWSFFAHATNQSMNTMITNERLIKRAYFPRVFLPAAAVLTHVVDLALASVVLLALLLLYGHAPSWRLLLLPAPVAVLVGTSLGAGLWLAALSGTYRDVRYGAPALVRLWMFASPVVYPTAMVPLRWQWLYQLNPLAPAIETFRWCFTGAGGVSLAALVAAVVVMIGALLTGLAYFRRVEGELADMV